MEISGRLIKILPEMRGETQRGPWVRGGFVIETDETYPKQIAFTTFGEDRLLMVQGLVMNSPVTVTFSPRSREYNERWYTDLECIRVQAMVAAQPGMPAGAPAAPAAAAPAAPAATPFASAPTMPADDNGDLPF
ncbi:MAG: DUF3127 domain-containing protein [Bacteroidales bacterium]|nr:DUF3127 domain-containing protein [Bacteroidales bacterium]